MSKYDGPSNDDKDYNCYLSRIRKGTAKSSPSKLPPDQGNNQCPRSSNCTSFGRGKNADKKPPYDQNKESTRLTDSAQCNPRDTKEHLAKIIIAQYHSSGAAEEAAEEFRRVHGGGSQGLPDDIPEVTVPADKMKDGRIVALDLIMACGFEKSRSEGRRIVAERGVRLNGRVLEDPNESLEVKTGDILQRGRRRFVRLVVP